MKPEKCHIGPTVQATAILSTDLKIGDKTELETVVKVK